MSEPADRLLRSLVVWLSAAVVAELMLLRTGTRTLIHVPGLDRFSTAIDVVGEAGRLAYYVSAVLVAATLGRAGWLWLRGSGRAGPVVGGLCWSVLVLLGFARLSILPPSMVGWLSLGAMLSVAAITWSGVKSVPAVLFVAAAAAVWWSVLGQGAGGGLTGSAVEVSVLAAEVSLVLAGITAPVLVRGRITMPALVAGIVAAIVISSASRFGGSTVGILTLWNLGVPGWLPPVAWGLALGSVVVTTWSAMSSGLGHIAGASILMVAGGVAPISTYQTALSVTAIVLMGVGGLARPAQPEGSTMRLAPGPPAPTRAGHLGTR